MATTLFRGTVEELINRQEEFTGKFVQVTDSPELELEDEDFYPNLPDPPFTVRDRAHLFELLDAGLASPTEPVTEEYWEDIRREVQNRRDERNKQK